MQPVFLIGQAATALIFILLQNLLLGLMTAAIVLVQAVVIPRLRKEQIRLGRERGIASRKLAGRVGEIVEAMPVVRVHATERFEAADIGSRLGNLFDIRFQLFKRKFGVKFLNNLLAQITPFLFYLVGGYLALNGSLDIGQLVAVIAQTTMKFNGLKKSAKDQKFKKDDGSEMSIYDYFKNEKNITLKYPGENYNNIFYLYIQFLLL